MAQFEYVDKLFPEGFKQDVEFLKRELPVLEAEMTALAKSGLAVYNALGSTRTLKDMVDNTAKAADVNTRVKTTVDALGQSYTAAEAIKAKYNGSSKEIITISKGVAENTLKEAKAATENAKAKVQEAKATTEVAKQKEIETRYTIALTREKEKLDKAAQKEEAKLKTLQSEYGKLNEEYKKAAEAAQNLGARQFRLQSEVAAGNNVQVNNTELARLGPQLADAQANALRLHTALLSVDQAVGKSQRNVGNYNSAQFAMSQLLREAPSFAYSFSTGLLALSNNIPILVDEINKMKVANEALKKSGAATVPIWKTLMGAITSPVGLITIATAAVTIFAARWSGAGESMSAAEKAASALTDQIKELNKATSDTYVNELAKTNELFASAEDLGLSYEARVKAIEKLMQLYPGLLSNLDQESILNGKVADKQDVISQIISKRAFIKYYEDLAGAITKSRTELEKQFAESNKSSGFYNPFSSSGTVQDMAKQQEQIKRLNAEIEDAKYNADILRREMQYLLDPKDTHTGRILVDIDAEIKKQELVRDTTTVEDKAHKAAIARLKELDEERTRYMGRWKDKKEKDFLQDGVNLNRYVVLAQTREQYEAEQEAKFQARLAVTKQMELALQDQRTKALEELNAEYDNNAISFEEYTKRKATLDKNFVYTSLILHREYYKALQKEYPNDERLEKLISDVNAAIANLQRENNKAKGKEFSGKDAAALTQQAAQQSIETTGALWDGYYQRQIDRQEQLLDSIQKRKETEIAAINATMQSDEKKQKQIQALNAQTAQQEKQIQAETRRLKREQAQADRVAGVLNVVLNTSVAVARALKDYAWPYSLIPAGIVAGMGAAQIAAIYAQPLPQYADGTEDHPGGHALVGEAGKEAIVEPGKAPYIVDRPTILNLRRHARVIPEKDLVAAGMGFLTPGLLQQINVGGGDLGQLKEELSTGFSRVEKAITNKPETQFIASNGEFKKIVKRGNNHYTYLTDNFA